MSTTFIMATTFLMPTTLMHGSSSSFGGNCVVFYAYSFVDVSCPVTRLINESPSSSSFKLSMCLSRCRNKKFTMAYMGSCFSLIAA